MRARGGGFQAHEWGSAPDLFGPRHDYRESLIMRRLLPAVPGPRVLNAGSGAGSLTLRMIDAGLDVTSVDADVDLCDGLRAQVGEAAVHAAPVERLPFADRSFDAVVCAEVLEHLDDDAAGLAELARVCRPGALLLVTVPGDPFRYDWTDLWAGHRRRYDDAGLTERIAEAGFVGVRVDGWGFPLSALYHRQVYRRALRRRLERGSLGGSPPALTRRMIRVVLELDTLSGGRRKGALGLIATARRSAGAARTS